MPAALILRIDGEYALRCMFGRQFVQTPTLPFLALEENWIGQRFLVAVLGLAFLSLIAGITMLLRAPDAGK